MAKRRPLVRGVVWFLCFQVALNSLGLSLLLAAEPTAVAGSGTEVTKVGDLVTDVRTGTIRGTNAFNDFQTFGVDAGHTVNLHLPLTAAGAQTVNLFNVVRQGQATVHGRLNAIKANQAVGGNVYFACPGGFVVGADGVVNVGSLTVSTPTLAWSEDLLKGTDGDANASSWVRDGSVGRVNLVPDGLISIQGTLNAADAISLRAATVEVAGHLLSGAQFAGERVDFSDVVNTGGLSSDPGDIRLVAEGGTSVSLALGAGAVVRGKNVSLAAIVDSDSVNPLNAISATMNVEGAEVTATEDLTLSARATQAPDMSNGVLELRSATADVHVAGSKLKAGGDLTLASKATTTVAMEGLKYAGPVRLAIGRASTAARAVVDGASALETTAGDVSVKADAATTLSAAKDAVNLEGASPIPGAASFSLSDVTNTATARVGGATTVATGGDLRVQARGLTDVATVADASLVGSAGAAASLALSFVNQNVTAEITDNASVTRGGDVSVTADGKTIQNTFARSGITSEEDVAGGLLKDVLAGTGALSSGQQTEVNSLIDKASGALGGGAAGPQVAGGVAFAKTGHTVSARLATTGTVTGIRNVTVGTRSLANVATLASGMTSGGSTGVGAAVAITTGRVSNSAELGSTVRAGGDVVVAAEGIDIDPQVPAGGSEPLADSDQSFSTKAYSGQSADGVGFAGALAIDNLETATHAVVTDRADVTATDLSLSATNVSSHEVVADGAPSETAYTAVDDLFASYETVVGASPAPARSVGVGASVALNFAENETTATLEGEATAHLSRDLSLSADSKNSTRTEAVSGTSGGIAVVPVLALSGTSDTTQAVVAEGDGRVTVGGDVRLSAVHGHGNTTLAKGDASGGETAAVGISASLALTEDTTTAAIDRSLEAGGGIEVRATSRVRVTSTGIASAGGSSDKPKDGSLNEKVSKFFAFKNAMKKKKKPGETGKAAKKAKTSEGGVSFAAAVGVTDAESDSQARIGAGARVSAGGALTLTNRSRLEASATGDGAASGGKAGIGAGVAINVATQSGGACVGTGADVEATSLTLDAKSGEAEGEANAFSAVATAGAGSSKLAIAGSVAINMVTSTMEALVDGVLRIVDAVLIESGNRSVSTATAGAVATESSSGGTPVNSVGAAFALNDVTNKSIARAGAGASMANRAALSLKASSDTTQTTTATAGDDVFGGAADPEPGAMGSVSLDAAVAMTHDANETRAVIDQGATPLETGAVSLVATAEDTNRTEAKGNASGTKAAVGACVAIGTNEAKTEALIQRDTDAHGDVSLASARTSEDTVSARATAMGLAIMRYVNKLKALGQGDTSQADVLSGKAGSDARASSKALAENNAGTGEKKKAGATGKPGSGNISVAAAVGVNRVKDTTRSGIASGVSVKSTGDVDVTASETSRFETEGSGAAVSSGVGIGVGVAITSLGKTTEAVVGFDPADAVGGGGASLTADGQLTVAAEASRNARSSEDGVIAARALAGAGAKDIGVAGSLALVNAANTTRAAILGGTVNAGETRVSADDTERLSARAAAASVSGKAGVGAGFALVNAGSKTQASAGGAVTVDSLDVTAARHRVGSGNTALTGFKDKDGKVTLDLGAHRKASNHYAEALAGSGAGSIAVSGAVAVNKVAETTEATVAPGAKITTVTGDVHVQANNASRTRTFAGGVAVAGAVGVGVSSATTVMDATTRAEVGKNATVVAARGLAVTGELDSDLAAGAVSAGGAGTVGVSGAVVVNSLTNQTSATIGSGATAKAGENLDLRAVETSSVTGIAGAAAGGGAAGIGGSVLVNTLLSETKAEVGQGATLEALGSGLSRGVETGDKQAGDDETLLAKGIALVAKAYQKVTGRVASGAGGGGAALAGSSSTTVAKTRTKVLVADGVTTTDAMAAAKGADLRMTAMDTTELSVTAGAASGAGGVAVGAGADVTVFSKETAVQVGSDDRPETDTAAHLRAGGSLGLAAASHDIQRTTVMGFSGAGTAAVSGSAAVTSMKNTVTAETGDGVRLGAGADLGISALENADLDHLVGSAAGAGVAGVGASASVMKVANTTSAATGTGTHLDAVRTLAVDATAREKAATFVVGAAGGGLAGVAGTASVKVMKSTTQARLGDASRVNDFAEGAAQDVRLSALHDLTVSGKGGSAAGGGAAGVGASADIAIIRATTTAEVGSKASVKAGRHIAVSAESRKEVSSATLAAAGGLAAGISGATSLVFIGEALDAKATESIGNGSTASHLDQKLKENQVGGAVEDTEACGALGETSGLSISGDINATSGELASPSGTRETRAATGDGVTLSAGGQLAVTARDKTHVALTSGALAAGVAGLGGDVAIARIGNATEAYTGDTNTLSAGSTLSISAAADNLNGRTSTVTSFAGAGGAVGAAVALAKLEEANVTRAYTGKHNTIARAGALTVSAGEDRDVKTEVFGAAAGALAGGVAQARSSRDSEVTARLGKYSRVGQDPGAQVGSLTVDTRFGGTATSHSTAGAAGVASGAGSIAETNVTSTLLSEVADGARARVTGDARVVSANEVTARSNAAGSSVGGIAAGSVTATTGITGTTESRVGESAHLAAGHDATVGAGTFIHAGTYDEEKDSPFAGETGSDGGAGGLKGIIQAASSVTIETDTTAEVGKDAEITAGETVEIAAEAGILAAARARLDSAGFDTGNDISASVTVTNNTKVAVGQGATLSADTVNLRSQTNYLKATAYAKSKTYAGHSTSKASSTVSITNHADVAVAKDALLQGDSAVTIQALQQGMAVESISDAAIKAGLTGSVSSTATANADSHAKVDLASGAKIETSVLTVESLASQVSDTYHKKAKTEAKTVVKLITTTIKTISKAFSWIPFVGRAVKKIVKWVTKTIEKVMDSEVEAHSKGSRSHDNQIVLDADVSLLGTANPELVIDEAGRVEKATAADVSVDGDGNLVVAPIINDKLGRVVLSADDGTVTGSGTIFMKNTYDTVTVTNRSGKNLTVGTIQVASQNGGMPAFDVEASNNHTFKIESGSGANCRVRIDNTGGGDVVVAGVIDNPFGEVSVGSASGDIATAGAGEIRASTLNLRAGGDIGRPGEALRAVMQPGEITADARGDINLLVSRGQGDATKTGDAYTLQGITRLKRVAAGGTLAVELRDGTTRVVNETVTSHTEEMERPAYIDETLWAEILKERTEKGESNTMTWNTYEYETTTPEAFASYGVGTLEGGGDVSVQAHNHADFTADRIASASGSVTVSVPNGSYAVGQVEAQNGTAALAVRDAITDAGADGAWNVKAKDFHLTSATAGIGGAEALKVVQTGVGGALSASAHGKVHLAAVENDLAFGDVTAGGPIAITGKGSLGDANGDGVNLTAGEIVLTSETGSVNLDVNSHKLTLAAATGIDVEETDGDLNLTRAVSEAGTVRLVAADNLLDIDGDTEVDVSGDRAELVARNGRIGSFGQRLRLDARQGAMAADGEVHVTADGDLALDKVTAAELVDLAVAGDLTDHNGDAVNISAGRAVLSAKGGLDTDVRADRVKVTATGAVDVEATEGDLTLESVTTGGDVRLGARGGDISGGDAAVDVTGAGVTLNAAGSVGASEKGFTINSDGLVNLSVGESAHLEETDGALRAGSLVAGKGISLAAATLENDGDATTRISAAELKVRSRGDVAADTAAGTLDLTISGDGNLTLREADALVVDRIALARGDVDLAAGGDLLGGAGATHISARNMRLRSESGGLGTPETRLVLASEGRVALDASKDLAVREADGMRVSTLASRTGSADLVVGNGRLEVSQAVAAKALTLTASAGDLVLGEAVVGSMDLESSQDMAIARAGSSGHLTAASGGRVIAQDLAAASLDVAAVDTIAIASVTSPAMRLVTTAAKGAVTVDKAVMNDAVIRANEVRLAGAHDGGKGRLTLDVEKAGGAASRSVTLALTSEPGVEVTNLQAESADITVASDDLYLASARILKRGDIRNAFNHVITDNGNLAPQACTLQLYPEGKRFSAHLKREFDVTTSARAVNYDDNFITNDFSTENSMVRQAEKEMARAAAPEPKKQGAPKPLSVGPVAAAVPVMAAPLSLPADAPPVALGDEGLGVDETFEVVAP